MRYLYALIACGCWSLVSAQTATLPDQPAHRASTWQWAQPVSSPTQSPLGARALFFEENFEAVTTPALPVGWSTSGIGPTDFYTGTAGSNAGQANEGGFWPVPGHSTFVMTNDDVCACNKTLDYLLSPVLDFTGRTDMGLSFEAYFDGNSSSIALVEMTINGGANWTPVVTLQPRVGVWQRYRHLPLPGSDNQGSVQIRFHFNDNLAFSTGLAIDDVQIDPIPDHNLSLQEVFFNGSSDLSQTEYYTQVPLRQAKAETLDFAGTIVNKGTAVQQNVTLGVSVSNAGAFIGQFVGGALATTNTTSLDLNPPGYTPSGIGTHKVTFSTLANDPDQETDDNVSVREFEVTPTEYARDNGNYSGNGFWYGPGNYQVGNRFRIHTADTVRSISVFFQENTNAGSQVHVRLYDSTLTTPLASVLSYNLTFTDIGAWTTFNLPATTLQPGEYVAVVEVLSGQVFLAADPTAPLAPPQTTERFTAGAWGNHIGPIPFIRLGLQPFNDPCPAVVTATVTAESCFGQNDGKIVLNTTGGTGPYAYQWSNSSTSDSISNLVPGNYQVTVTYDGGNCVQQSSYAVFGPDSLQLQFNASNEVCGDAGGSLTALVSGGTPPLAYAWNQGSSSVQLQNLTIGTYTVTVTDQNGCTVNNSGAVGGTPGVAILPTLTEPGCGQNNGVIAATPTSGPGPYNYAWSHDGALTDSNATALTAGSYTVTVSDGNGCTNEFLLFLNNQGSANLSTQQIIDADCFGASTGGIDLSANGGTPPYTYAWNDPSNSTTQNLSGAPAGIYQVSVTDASGCQSFHFDTINEPEGLLVTSQSERAACFGDSSGAASVQVSGGTPGYTYLWNTGSTNDSIFTVPGGSYTVTVTDNQGCTQQNLVVILQPDSIEVVAAITGEDTTTGGNGSIDLTVSGGTAPYGYFWSNNSFTQDQFNLNGGGYWVIVTDDDGCQSDTIRFFVPYPTGLPTISQPLQDLSIYPNPSEGQITIRWSNATDFPVDVSLLSVTGQLIDQTQLSAESGRSMSVLEYNPPQPGIYLIRFENGQGVSMHRVMFR